MGDVTAEELAPALHSPFERMDRLRGNAFGAAAVGNSAAPLTVSRGWELPLTMAHQTMIYLEPLERVGAATYDSGKLTSLFSLQNREAEGAFTTFGVTNGSLALVMEWRLDRHWLYEESLFKEIAVGEGDHLGIVAAFAIDSLQLTFKTTFKRVEEELKTPTKKELFYDLVSGATLTNYRVGQEGLVWQLSADVGRHERLKIFHSSSNQIRSYNDTAAHYSYQLGLDLGYKLLQKRNARLFAGLNGRGWVGSFDRVEGLFESHLKGWGEIAPNIVTEVALGRHCVVYDGFSHTERLSSSYLHSAVANENNDHHTVNVWVMSGATDLCTGFRFDAAPFSIEASLTDQLFSSGPAAIFSDRAGGLIAKLGAMVLF